MPLPKSKTFWAFASTASLMGAAVIYDRQKLKSIRRGFIEEATAMGMQPSVMTPRKVTVVSFAKDSFDARKTKQLWRHYAVDLLTLAGCDYQLIEFNSTQLDKELDKRIPVPEGQAPPEEKTIAKLINPDNWLRPTMLEWMQRSNGKPLTKEISEDPAKAELIKMREETRPEPKSRVFFEDGIVPLEKASYDALVDGVADFCKDHGSDVKAVPRLGYIPCDPFPSWRTSVYYVSLS
jgi:hypothetical protein